MRNVMRMTSSRTARGIAAAALLVGLSGTALAQTITVGNVEGAAGTTVQIPVSFTIGDSGATGLTIDVGFGDTPGFDVGNNNRPACVYSQAITEGKPGSAFSFRPGGCVDSDSCTAGRAAIFTLDEEKNGDPVPEGELYTCAFTVPEDAETGATFAFSVAFASYILPTGAETPITNTTGGTVTVAEPVPPTNTVVAATPTATPGGNTPTRTQGTPGGGGGGDDDGCQVVAPSQSNVGWLLMIPAIVLFLRRRNR